VEGHATGALLPLAGRMCGALAAAALVVAALLGTLRLPLGAARRLLRLRGALCDLATPAVLPKFDVCCALAWGGNILARPLDALLLTLSRSREVLLGGLHALTLYDSIRRRRLSRLLGSALRAELLSSDLLLGAMHRRSLTALTNFAIRRPMRRRALAYRAVDGCCGRATLIRGVVLLLAGLTANMTWMPLLAIAPIVYSLTVKRAGTRVAITRLPAVAVVVIVVSLVAQAT